jgi:tetratricopeptide (TPR) repeat protein
MLARRVDAARRTLVLLAFAGGLLVPAGAAAQGSSDELARRHFDSGTAYLEESDYENALKAFQKSYDLSKRPAILLNIATVQERRGDLKAAIAALDGYLQAEPNGEHAETTRLRIQNLTKRLEAEAQPVPAPPPAPPPPPPPPEPPAPAPAKAPAPASGKSKLPAFIAFGIGGAGAVTAVVTGILANSEYRNAEDECSPRCSDEQVATGKTLAWVSTIATGVAVVGAGVGITLFLTSSGDGAAATAPTIRVGFGASGPSAEARLRF